MARHFSTLGGVLLVISALLSPCPVGAQTLTHIQGEMAGEVTHESVILQSRLTWGDSLVNGDVPGHAGVACFELSTHSDFRDAFRTEWIRAVPENDYIVKTLVTDLEPGTRYYYRVHYGENETTATTDRRCEFRTLPGRDAIEGVSFVVVTGMNYAKFQAGYEGTDKALGFPALETIRSMQPDFIVFTGDNVYYDHPPDTAAITQYELRRKWHQQFVQPRFLALFAEIPAYWQKDDHDFRFNDCDLTGERPPLPDLGIQTFREQVPVVDPSEPASPTYRTYRINRLLQIWLVEGRNFRSPNRMPDGPGKSIWGPAQKAWLKRTLKASDATFKLLISPTPMVGPDDGYKRDNHSNIDGFQYEGEEFFSWLTAEGFLHEQFHIICGDRHWQYHSLHPSGFGEFSSGALVDANSRLGRKPGDPRSTDPDSLIMQLYTQQEPSGGFLKVTIRPDHGANGATLEFAFHDENGILLYRHLKHAPVMPSGFLPTHRNMNGCEPVFGRAPIRN